MVTVDWDENCRKRQRICSTCKIYFLTGKNMAALNEITLQMVTYLHADNHVKPRRAKMPMQMKAGRKEHKNNERHHSVSFAFVLDKNWIEGKWQSV